MRKYHLVYRLNIESDITEIRNNEFKPNENSKKTPQESETIRKNGPEGI